jgi:predicted nucleic acid-binding protein
LLVVDASVAFKWFIVDEDWTDRAMLIADAIAAGNERVIAPDLIAIELASSLAVAARRGRVPLEELAPLIDDALEYCRTMELFRSTDLLKDAAAISVQSGCSVYDGLYAALAGRERVPLISADRRLVELCRARSIQALWIGDFRGIGL